MFRCPYCTKPNQPAVSFCIHCGEPLDEYSLAELAASGPQQAILPPPSTVRMASSKSAGLLDSLRAMSQGRRLELVLGLALVTLVVGYVLLNYVRDRVGEDHYLAAKDAIDRGAYALAANEYSQAGDYQDSKQRLADATDRLNKVDTLYSNVQKEASSGRWWELAHDIASSDDLQKSHTDTIALLARARNINGKIVFQLDNSSNPGQVTHGLYVAEADGGNRQYITGTNFLSRVLAISPDDKWMVYVNLGDEGTYFSRPTPRRVYLYNLQTGASLALQLPDLPTVDTWAQFAEGGQGFLVGNDTHVTNFDLTEGLGPRPLAPVSTQPAEARERSRYKSVIRTLDGEGNTALAVTDYDGTNPHIIAWEQGLVDGALFSRDGGYLAYRVCTTDRPRLQPGEAGCDIMLADLNSPQQPPQEIASVPINSGGDSQHSIYAEFTLDGHYLLVIEQYGPQIEEHLYNMQTHAWRGLPDGMLHVDGSGGTGVTLVPDYSPGLGFWEGANSLAHTDHSAQLAKNPAGTGKHSSVYRIQSHAMIVGPNDKYAVYVLTNRQVHPYNPGYLDFNVYSVPLSPGPNGGSVPQQSVRLGHFDYVPSSNSLADSIRLLPDGNTMLTSVVYEHLTFHGINAFQMDSGKIDVIATEPDTNTRARLLADNRPSAP